MKNIFRFTVLALIFCMTFFILLPQQADAQASDELARLLRNARIQPINQRLEPSDFTLQFLSGGSAALSSYKGKVVILNFWATWCPPCREEMPSMETLYQRYKNNGFEMLAVNIRENTDTVRQFIQRNNYNFPIMLDLDGRVNANYGVISIPTTFIINKEGRMVGRVIGSIYWDTPQIFAVMDHLLN